MRERIDFGIKNLDDLMGGGIPAGNQVIVAGGPGAGKTLLAFEFLYNNARKGHISSLFSLEEKSSIILDNVKTAFTSFTDIDDLIKKGMLNLYGAEENEPYLARDEDSGSYQIKDWIGYIQGIITSTKSECIVIDSISVLKILIRDMFDYRNLTIQLIADLKNLNVTSLVNMELETADKDKLTFQPEFFIYDGIIALYLAGEGHDRVQTLEIIKMRGTQHSFNTVPYEITSSGIRLLSVR
ncbi:MAG: ATPase domain-containing protein [Candidatus Micrarchaeaceae archaeon]